MKQPRNVIEDWISSIQEEGKGLTTWEMGFVESVDAQLAERGSISERQEEILERIYADKTP